MPTASGSTVFMMPAVSSANGMVTTCVRAKRSRAAIRAHAPAAERAARPSSCARRRAASDGAVQRTQAELSCPDAFAHLVGVKDARVDHDESDCHQTNRCHLLNGSEARIKFRICTREDGADVGKRAAR